MQTSETEANKSPRFAKKRGENVLNMAKDKWLVISRNGKIIRKPFESYFKRKNPSVATSEAGSGVFVVVASFQTENSLNAIPQPEHFLRYKELKVQHRNESSALNQLLS